MCVDATSFVDQNLLLPLVGPQCQAIKGRSPGGRCRQQVWACASKCRGKGWQWVVWCMVAHHELAKWSAQQVGMMRQ